MHQQEFILYDFCFSYFQELYKRKSSKILQNRRFKRHNGLSKARRCEPSQKKCELNQRRDSRELNVSSLAGLSSPSSSFSASSFSASSSSSSIFFLGFLVRKFVSRRVFLHREDLIAMICFFSCFFSSRSGNDLLPDLRLQLSNCLLISLNPSPL